MSASRTSLNSYSALQTIAVLPLSGTTVTATAVPSTTGLAVVDGTTIAFRSDGITLSDGQVFSLGFDGLVDSTNTGKWTSVSIPTTSIPHHDDLRRRQETENASIPKDQPIQVSEPQTSSVPPNSPTNAYSSTAVTGVSSPSPSSYTGVESTTGGSTGMQSGSMTSLTSSGISQVTASITTISSETTIGSTTGTRTVTTGPNATSTAGAAGTMQSQTLGLEAWMVAVLGLVATFGGMFGM